MDKSPADQTGADEQDFVNEVMWQPPIEDNVFMTYAQDDPDPISKKEKGKKKKM